MMAFFDNRDQGLLMFSSTSVPRAPSAASYLFQKLQGTIFVLELLLYHPGKPGLLEVQRVKEGGLL